MFARILITRTCSGTMFAPGRFPAKTDRSSGHLMLLRVDTRSGHGQGKPLSNVVEGLVDEWSFVYLTLGITL